MKSDMDDLWDRYVDVTNIDASPRASRSGIAGAFMQPRKIAFLENLEAALAAFSPGERLTLYLLSAAMGLSALILIAGVNALASVTVPAAGGTLVEGEVGPARFINPLLTLSQPDQDLTALIYSGLMRALPDGSFAPDLAESYTVSDDGRIYSFKLRPTATFQDGSKVTSADVLFTIEEALNPAIDSPHRADWTGVAVSAPDEHTVVFTLPHAYAPFIGNTTLGILPKARWENVSPEEFPFNPLNTHPIGSGPYKIDNVATDATGAALRYELSAFKNYTLGTPFLSHMTFVFFSDEDALIKALNAHQIDAASALPADQLPNIKRTDVLLVEASLPRVFGVFFNQSHNPVLADNAVREALDADLDKGSLVQNALSGRAEVLSGPIPPGTLGARKPAVPQPITLEATSTSARTNADEARNILTKAGWIWTANASSTEGGAWSKDKKTLSFTLATADQPELVATARQIVAAWKDLGVQATLQIYPLSELNTSVIRPRSYDALLFGEVVGPELDLYAFWHSSQRNDPGLNLALYANPKTDALLSQARATVDESRRNDLYNQFADLLEKDHPAVFLYAPDFLYVVPRTIQGVTLGTLADPSDRFQSVYQWYMDTERIWKIFSPSHY